MPALSHGHAHDGHGHGSAALQVIEEPLDPANQSLADALRLSFYVLKFLMLILVVIFLLSGLVCVDQSEVVVLSRFGRLVGDAREPGLHFAWPSPVDEQIRVSTSLRTLAVDAFWLELSEQDKTRSLSELDPRGSGLDPAVDGALLTGDRAIMHLLLNVQYRVNNEVRVRANETDPERQISDVMLFVRNVSHEEDLLRSVIQNAAVAEASRTTADVVWKDASRLAAAIQGRAQQVLDRLETGIALDKVAAEQSYFPLQAREEFLGVSTAENHKRQLINEAESERAKKLLGIAGPAWEALSEEIEKLDQSSAEDEREGVIRRIEEILETQATGEAGGMIRLAQRDREKIVADVLAEVSRFEAYLPEYKAGPDLVRRQLQAAMLEKLFGQPGVVKWVLPAGDKELVLTLNKDPEEIREAERERMRKKTGAR
ncbi:MAG: hypothetical protein GXY55_16240 [Phycisphaerae bacterium]|nr:hypothetical protein [Phycisphaerae bacterium]